MDPITLTAPGLILSVPTSADVDAIDEACRDPEVSAWTTVPAPYSREHAEGFLTHVVVPGWVSGRSLTWAIRDADGALGGMIGLDGIADGSAEIGFWVAPWARGKGFVTRATGLVLDTAFEDARLALLRVRWRAFVGNWPSRRAAWKAGFRFEGTSRLDGLQRGARRDQWVAGITYDDPRGAPNEPWPADAPADLRPVPPETAPVPVDPAARGRMGA